MLGKLKARRISEQVLSQCGGQAAQVLLFLENLALTRFARNAIQEEATKLNSRLVLQIIVGNRLGTATVSQLDDESLTVLVARARMNAEANPVRFSNPGLTEPTRYPDIEAFDSATAHYPAERRERAVEMVCKLAESKGLSAAGAFSTGSGGVVVANSKGLFAFFTSTFSDFETLVTSEDSSGYAHASAWRVGDLPVEALGREAIEKAALSRNPQPVEVGEYPVVVDPYVTEDILQMLNVHGMSALDVNEERSWMNELIGKQALDEKVSIWDDGLNLAGLPMPFDFEGTPKQRVDIVRHGMVLGPVYDLETASRMGKTSTGHAMPLTFRGMGPLATNLFMGEGDSTLDEMIQSTERGLYITRVWYTRLVDPHGCLVSGMTRDGVFMIKNGQIAYPVKNLYFTQSYVESLANVEMISKESRLLGSEFGGIALRVPALKFRKFNFTGTVN